MLLYYKKMLKHYIALKFLINFNQKWTNSQCNKVSLQGVEFEIK